MLIWAFNVARKSESYWVPGFHEITGAQDYHNIVHRNIDNEFNTCIFDIGIAPSDDHSNRPVLSFCTGLLTVHTVFVLELDGEL